MKYDVKLTKLGKQRDASVKKKKEDVWGRVPKEEWATHIGTDLDLYKDSKTHLPSGVSYVLPTTVPKEVQDARKMAESCAFDRAESDLKCRGNRNPTNKEVKDSIAEQDLQTQKLNHLIAQNIEEMRGCINKGQEDEKELLLRQILHKHAENDSGKKLPGEPKKLSAEEKQEKNHQYYHFLNRAKSKKSGGK